MYLGLDISLVATGLVKLNADLSINHQALIKSKPAEDRFRRFDDILKSIKRHLDGVRFVVIEGYSYGSKGNSLVNIAELSGMIKHHLWTISMPFIEVPPTSLKKFITGAGNSPKDVMMMKVYKRYGIEFTDNNLCDAYCLAVYGKNVFVDK